MYIDLKEKLDELVALYNVPSFVEKDPVQFPRRFSNVKDIEISALLTSIIAWGRRDSILKNGDKMHAIMHNEPYAFIMNQEYKKLQHSPKNIHRTFFEKDMYPICEALYGYYLRYDSLQQLFVGQELLQGIGKLSSLLRSKHLASPLSQSPCKRTHMMLRWLVRNDHIVDLGVWDKCQPSTLIIPLDTHVSRVSRLFWDDLPKTDTLKTAIRITAHLSRLCPDDPCKYDFALFGMGEAGQTR